MVIATRHRHQVEQLVNFISLFFKTTKMLNTFSIVLKRFYYSQTLLRLSQFRSFPCCARRKGFLWIFLHGIKKNYVFRIHVQPGN